MPIDYTLASQTRYDAGTLQKAFAKSMTSQDLSVYQFSQLV